MAIVTEGTAAARALRDAVLRTVAYADLFDHPLEPAQVHRWLIGARATPAEVAAALDDPTLPVERTRGLVHLPGRGGIVATRELRVEASARLWADARRWGRVVARLPLVRGVAVTGALAMHNAEPGSDIDLFVLARPGRVWTCRALVIAVVRLAALRGVRLCPNFVLGTDHLALAQRDLFTAHEIAQMVPIGRSAWLDAFFAANAWTRAILPNAGPSTGAPAAATGPLVRAVGAVLASPVLDPLERWEMRRKIRRLEARARVEGGTVAFSAQECRGHFAAHDVRVLAGFAARAGALGLGT
jgi:predicted nucleotidyltransferase